MRQLDRTTARARRRSDAHDGGLLYVPSSSLLTPLHCTTIYIIASFYMK